MYTSVTSWSLVAFALSLARQNWFNFIPFHDLPATFFLFSLSSPFFFAARWCSVFTIIDGGGCAHSIFSLFVCGEYLCESARVGVCVCVWILAPSFIYSSHFLYLIFCRHIKQSPAHTETHRSTQMAFILSHTTHIQHINFVRAALCAQCQLI